MRFWALVDHFVEEAIELYLTREQAEQALRDLLTDEPEWAGMFEVEVVGLLAGGRN